MADFRGVIKGTRVKDLVYGDHTDLDHIKVIDPGIDGLKSPGASWYIPVRLFESLEPLDGESNDG